MLGSAPRRMRGNPYPSRIMQTETIAQSIARAPYAFPGGYARLALTDDGGTLCAACCKNEAETIAASDPGDGWHVVAEYVHWEGEPETCDHCAAELPSEYGPIPE